MRDYIIAVLWGFLALMMVALCFSPPPEPIRADPQPTAICSINEDTVTSDGTMEWPEGSYAPCKWFKKEQDV